MFSTTEGIVLVGFLVLDAATNSNHLLVAVVHRIVPSISPLRSAHILARDAVGKRDEFISATTKEMKQRQPIVFRKLSEKLMKKGCRSRRRGPADPERLSLVCFGLLRGVSGRCLSLSVQPSP